jgi:hypothetical protein
MAYIPKGAEWYVAEIVQEIIVEGDARNVVHRNLILINAHSPDEAYDRAINLGREGESEYQNPAGQKVVIKFRGLGALSVVHDQLEHGAELRYIEDTSVSETKITELVKTKEQLSVFQDRQPTQGPDYACKEIVDEALELMGIDPEDRKQDA